MTRVSIAVTGVSRYNGSKGLELTKVILRLINTLNLRFMDLNKKLLTLKEVVALVSMSRSTIYRGMEAGWFPRPLKIGSRMVRWTVADIDAYLDRLSCTA